MSFDPSLKYSLVSGDSAATYYQAGAYYDAAFQPVANPQVLGNPACNRCRAVVALLRNVGTCLHLPAERNISQPAPI